MGGEAEACIASVTLDAKDLPESPGRPAVVLRPGDTVCLTPASGNGWHAVARAGARTPHVRARASSEKGMTMLAVRNATSGRLAYRAALQLRGDAAWRETSTIPVMAGLENYESWQDPIEALALFELRLE